MKRLTVTFLLSFFICLTCFGQNASSNDSVSFDALSAEQISLKESPVWVQTSPSSLHLPLVSSKDSLYSRQTFERKAFRAARIIFVGELATMAFFAAMPESFSNWNKNFYRNAPVHWRRAFTLPPKLDDDPIIVNYVQHPLGGALYYNGVRSQGATQLQSFIFSFAESTFFEYFIESVAERPSIQDLIVTPIGGCLIGELEYKVTLAMRKNGFNFAEKVFVFLINPLYVVFNGYKTDAPHYHVQY